MRQSNCLLNAIFLTLILASNLNLIQTTSPRISQSTTDRNFAALENTIPLLVQSNHDLQPDELRSLNALGLVTTVAGPVAVLHVQTGKLSSVRPLSFLSTVQRSHALSVYLDKSVPDIGANTVWRTIMDPYDRNVTGAGIIIGFVDTGIDIVHPDFTFPNGTTKILYVWDQTSRGRPPLGFGYGYECASADIQDRTCPEVDTFGHGTHVAGIAASSGQAPGKYAGVAPDARIIFVKSGQEVCNGGSWNFYDSQILDGINYIVKKAAQLKMRAVISLSLGGNIGGHDGTAPLEVGLDAFVRSGTPIAVAAGNAARDNAHVRGHLSQGRNVTVNVQIRSATVGLQIDIWHSNQDRFDATLTAPDGETYSIPTPLGGMMTKYGNITTLVNTSVLGRELYMEVNSSDPLASEVWKVTLKADEVTETGVWDAWVDTSTCAYPGAFFLPGDGYEIDTNDTIGIPGTARFVVTVGAYVTKASWVGMDGETHGRNDLPIGGIASFSSLGPTRDGRVKPDIVAPGVVVTSARSSAIAEGVGDPDAFHRVLAGTSMATPHVAGIIALMLQYEPDLQATAALQILRETARLDAFTGLIPMGSPVWGFGKVDSRTATGFVRLTLVSQGLPENIGTSVHVDGTESYTIKGSSWNYLYFLKGTSHVISIDTELQSEVGTRYELADGSFNSTANALKVLNYTVQYLLTVNSQFGSTSGSGWYDAGDNVRSELPTRAAATGLLGKIGAEYVLTYLITENGQIAPSSLTMDGPRTVTAIYVLTFPLLTIAALGVLAVAIAFSISLVVRRPARSPKAEISSQHNLSAFDLHLIERHPSSEVA